jgi:CRP/FNR family transcriptional regulator, cyclic AMP receptor protein
LVNSDGHRLRLGEAQLPEDLLELFDREPDGIVLQPGQDLFRKGDGGRHMYVVKSGQVQVIDGDHVLDTVSSGGIVGEMALVSSEVRSATVRALSKSVVVPVDDTRFLFLVQQTPFFAIRVMRVMSARLKTMNDRLTSMREAHHTRESV